jgi:glycosyltransferase involved in cell wall biosynthesis
LAQELANAEGHELQVLRYDRNFKGPVMWIYLFFKAFFAAKADVIITVARLAWPVYLRNRWNKTKILLVLHNHDENDGKRRVFYTLINSFLNKQSAKLDGKFKLICISEYWRDYFNNKFNLTDKIIIFPNFFEIEKLIFFRGVAKKSPGLIHLGQWSEKIDKKAYRILMYALKQKGYAYYFSSNQKVNIPDFPISYFEHHEAYLKQMCIAHVTVVMNKVNEGWPRLVHESMLLGTPVITTNQGGMAQLVNLGNGYCLNSVEEVMQAIEKELKPINYDGIEKFSTHNAQNWVQPLVAFCNGT